MKYYRTIGLQITTFLFCLIMMILQIATVAKGLPENHTLFTFMVIFAFVFWLAGFIISFVEQTTVGFGLVALGAFLVMVGCALPNASSGSLSELLIIYIPILLVPVSMMMVRGGANFKRVMLVTIGILYTIVSIYMIANSIQSLDGLRGTTSYASYYYASSSVSAQRDALQLQCAYSFFSLFYYLCMVICGGVLFRNEENITD